LLNEAKSRGMHILNYTDHDRFTLEKMLQMTHDAWIISYHSAEISACNYDWDRPKSLHLTCYLSSRSLELEAACNNTITKKVELITKQFEKLIEYGFRWDINELYRYYKVDRNLDMLNKYDLSRYILTKSRNNFLAADLLWVDAMKNVDPAKLLTECLQPWSPHYENFDVQVPYYEPSVEHIWSLAHQQSWILSIAHPNFSFADIWPDWFEKVFPQYYEMWVNAIEISSFADIKWLSVIYRLAKKYNLTLTIWSDNHILWQPDKTHANFWELNPVIVGMHWEVDAILRSMIAKIEA